MAPLDTIREIATPEGCALELRIAGPLSRVRAWLYDFLLRLVGWAALGLLAALAGPLGAGLSLVGAFLLEWFYPILFEVYMGGQTPGKRACDLMVVHDDGRPVGWNASFIRNTVRFVDFLPFLYVTGFLTALLNADGKRLGDLAAGTVVVHCERRPADSPAPTADDEKGSEPPPLPLRFDEQQALLEFHRRAGQLTEARAQELAELPTPLIEGLSPAQARRRLLRIGNFLLGRR